MNAARPAVQLCWPYQSVNSVPSFARRSILGVRYPITPRLYALMFSQPISSPQIIKMFGFFVAIDGVLSGICRDWYGYRTERIFNPTAVSVSRDKIGRASCRERV